MDSKSAGFSSVDEYIGTFPPEIQALLEQIRETIRAAAPDAKEKISYQMPAFEQKGNLVYYAAWKTHIGFYPVSSAVAEFEDELSKYPRSKGAIQFPFNQPLPLDLIRRVVEYRVAENLANDEAKKARKKQKPSL